MQSWPETRPRHGTTPGRWKRPKVRAAHPSRTRATTCQFGRGPALSQLRREVRTFGARPQVGPVGRSEPRTLPMRAHSREQALIAGRGLTCDEPAVQGHRRRGLWSHCAMRRCRLRTRRPQQGRVPGQPPPMVTWWRPPPHPLVREAVGRETSPRRGGGPRRQPQTNRDHSRAPVVRNASRCSRPGRHRPEPTRPQAPQPAGMDTGRPQSRRRHPGRIWTRSNRLGAELNVDPDPT